MNFNSIKKDLQWLWDKLGGQDPKLEKTLTVEQFIKKMQNGELKANDEVCVGALCEKITPRQIMINPGFSERETNVAVIVGEGAAAFCPHVGTEFFLGVPSNYIYLAQINWSVSFYLKVYFPANEVGEEFLGLLNNMGVVVVGRIEETSVPYSCTREEVLKGKTVVQKFTSSTSFAIRAKALFHVKQWDPVEPLKDYISDVRDMSLRNHLTESRLEIYWLRGRP